MTIVPEATSPDITIEYHLQDESDSNSPEKHMLTSVGHTLYLNNVRKPISQLVMNNNHIPSHHLQSGLLHYF